MNSFNEPDILFHYTSLDAFFKMIKNKEFWLSDITKSNDPLEGVYLIQVLEEAYDDLYRERKIYWNDYSLIHRAFLLFKEIFFRYGRTRDFYGAASFCTSAHELSMLKIYADKGEGVALGVPVHILNSLTKINPHLIFRKIEYLSREELMNRARDFCVEQIRNFQDKITDINEETLRPLVEAIEKWCNNGFFIKDPATKDEEEYRLLYRHNDIFEYYLPQFGESIPEEIDFTTQGGDLKAHYKIRIGEVEKSDFYFRSITLAPLCKSSICDIQAFLRKYGIKGCNIDKNTWVKMR